MPVSATKRIPVIVVPTTDPARRPVQVLPLDGHYVFQAMGMVPDGMKLCEKPYLQYREEVVSFIWGNWPHPGGGRIRAEVQTFLSPEEIAELVNNPQYLEVPA